MASVEKKDIPLEAEFMSHFWAMIKKFWIPEDSDEYWNQIAEYANELYKKYHTDFCKEMILCFCDYLDTEHRKKRTRKNEQTTEKSGAETAPR